MENKYHCTLVGIGNLQQKEEEAPADDRGFAGDLFLMAWGHQYGDFSIFEGAKILAEMGAQAVLLIDEGSDVFHHYFEDMIELSQFIKGKKMKKIVVW